jgi:effector-binding domain-containing protein
LPDSQIRRKSPCLNNSKIPRAARRSFAPLPTQPYNRCVPYSIELKQVAAQPIQAVYGLSKKSELPANIRGLFDQFYAGFKGKGGLNIVVYSPFTSEGDFEIGCGVQLESGGNAATPGGLVATTTHIGPYEKLRAAHDALHQWVHENGHKLAGPSWEVYGHWNEDPAKLRTDVFYLLQS